MTDPKMNAYDQKSAAAGEISSEPELNTVDQIATEAGVELPAGATVGIKSRLQERDENRWELNPDSDEKRS